eukprot:6175183-Pleurochrysis_carterae.AAC.1
MDGEKERGDSIERRKRDDETENTQRRAKLRIVVRFSCYPVTTPRQLTCRLSRPRRACWQR